ncbi:tubulin/FtsZ family, GTPase domain-containing protein [Toxoplasma gondii p89]|uniref:Tubulin/FtsZ family, GTPase domain-containing protein n=1 Tax=Toxoplasma gondii p89 TaxID=943119 RepID=A0A086KT10_TOXGO|nr:tubulin/FtsZ family, GTPase domain-containing protein [Toxoplasma gondii p89]
MREVSLLFIARFFFCLSGLRDESGILFSLTCFFLFTRYLLSLSPFLSFSFAWQQTKQAVHLSFDRHSSSSSLSSSRSSFSRSPRFLRASPRTTMTGEKGDTISRAGERKRERRKCAFAEMNAIVAQTLSHLTR